MFSVQFTNLTKRGNEHHRALEILHLNLRMILASHKIICLFVQGLGLDVSRQAHSLLIFQKRNLEQFEDKTIF